jgi:Cu+-exporting ATPase
MLNQKQSLKIASIVILDGRDETEFLALAGSIARVVDEPLGSVILAASSTIVDPMQVDHLRSTASNGVAGWVQGHAVIVGNSSFLSDLGITIGNVERWAERSADENQSVIFVAVDDHLAGFIRVYGLKKGRTYESTYENYLSGSA